MARIVECVPNFSEGRRKEVIEAIASAIGSTVGCNLLDVDPGVSTNRTVYTFVGTPECVVEGALNGARAAAQLIDMSSHTGEHPRMGALDVCPFIPVEGVTMEECINCAKAFGARLAREIGVPVYLYNEAATQPHRKTLPQIRSGEYEGLVDKLLLSEWQPDFGTADFVPTWGATVTGARKFLIAYNVNVLSTKEQAHRIALNIREQGRSADQPGRLKCVQAIGWYLEEANMAQVSINLTDHDVTPMHIAYEECVKDAKSLNLATVGSQVVGLVPLKAILQAAEHYIEREKLFILEEDQKIRLVIDRLGLNTVGIFNPKERIIEYIVSEDDEDGPLESMSVKDFVLTVAGRTPSPGGGSVAALVASLGAALSTMTGFLSYGNRKFETVDYKMRTLIPHFYKAMKGIMPMIDADAAAFSEYMSALKLSKTTEEEIEVRDKIVKEALMTCIQVPMSLLTTVNGIWPHLEELADVGNVSCKSDLQVGARCLETAAWGAFYNIKANLTEVKEDDTRNKILAEAEDKLKKTQESTKTVLEKLEEH